MNGADEDEDEKADLISLDYAAEPGLGLQVPGPTALRTHPASACAQDPSCCIHNPSRHPLVNAPQNWRGDRELMERICPHGIGHPDPDDIAYKRRSRGEGYAWAASVHGCDGCCRRSTTTIDEEP